jgi:2-aminoethylphosphonate-pyruvate transaminase
VVVALDAALAQYLESGGQPARLARYTANCETLVGGMAEMGFRVFLDPKVQAPIIVTFHAPADPKYAFKEFYDRVRDKGFILYPGKLTQVETFRVGCIGAIGPEEMRHAVNAVRDTLREMGIRQVAPAAAPAAIRVAQR